MTQQEWEALNATMGYSPEQDASIRKSVQQATANGATVPPGYQNLLPSVASWMPGEEQYSIFNSPEYGEVDAFGYDSIDSASTGVLDKYSSEVNDPSSNVNKVEVKKHNADGTVTTTTTENKTNTPSFKGTKDKDKDKMRVPMTNAGGMTVIATSPEEVAMYQNNGYVAPNTEMAYPEVGTGSPQEKQDFDNWRNEYNSRPEMKPSQFFDNPMVDTDAMGNPIQDQNFAGMNTNDGADQYAQLLNTQEGIDPNDDYYEGYIPSNDSLEGNYYGDEVSGDADNSFFNDTEWGGYNATPKTMYHPSGFSRVINEPEAPLFIRDGYFNTKAEATEDREAQTAFDKAEAGQDFFNNQWDAEEASLANIPSWLGTSKGPLSDVERDELVAMDQGIDAASDTAMMLDQDYSLRETDYDRMEALRKKRWAESKLMSEELDAASDTQEMMEQDWEMDNLGVPIEERDISMPDKAPIVREEIIISKDHEEVNKSEVAKEVVTTFQDRINSGANPEAEIKRFVDSSGHLKEWRPQLFKAILGTLIGVASGESFGASATAGFGVVGEDIARQEKVDAEIAKEDRKFVRDLTLKQVEAGGKAVTARKDLLKFTTKRLETLSTNYNNNFFASMDKKMKEKINKKIPDVAQAYKTSFSAYASRAGISEDDLVAPVGKKAKGLKRIFDSGMRDWMKSMRAQAQGDDDISLSSSPDAFIRARAYHTKLTKDKGVSGDIAPMLFDKEGNLDAERLLSLRASVDTIVKGSDNYQNADEVFKSLIKIWRKLSLEDRKDLTFLEFANSQVGQLK